MRNNSELVAIESKSGVTIYGKVINSAGKLGQYEVHSDFMRDNGTVYNMYSEAETRMNAMVGVKNN